MQVKKTLIELGFTSKEASIYLAGIELGQSPVSSIARKAGENRVTTYGILKEFCKSGISQEIVKNDIKYYVFISPQDLFHLWNQKTKKLEEVLPEMIGMMNSLGVRPKVLFYEGIEGLKKVFYDILATKEPYRVLLGTQDIHPDFHDFLKNELLPFRLKIKIKTRAIVSKHDSHYAEYNRKNHESIVIKDPIFDMANEIIIYDYDKVALCLYSRKEMSAIVVHSPALHDSMGALFELVWKTYKKQSM